MKDGGYVPLVTREGYRPGRMQGIHGVYEVAIKVRDLGRAETFYRDVLGLEVGLHDASRRWTFLRVGGDGMIVLQEDAGVWPHQHFAFRIRAAELDAAAAELRRHGIAVDGPIVHEWIPATSIYFADPDGHDLELCVPL
jgi:lactoylglutathione lyase